MTASADKNTGAQLTSLDSRWLLVVGGGNLEGGPDGTWRTKAPVAQYLNQLAAYFDRCVWMAPRLHHPLGLTGRLDDNVVEIVPFDEDPLGFLKFMVSFALLCRGRPLALLFLPAIMPLLPLMPLARLLCRRMVIYLGTDYDGQLKRKRPRTRPGRTLAFRVGHEYPMRLADTVLARGGYLARIARNFNEKVIETVPIVSVRSPYPPIMEEERRNTPPRILFLGKLALSKGVGDLLEALCQVLKRHPDVALDLVGDGADRASLETMAVELGVTSAAQFHGWVESEQELSRFFGRAQVLVVPSSDPEGVPRVINEALGHGLPVIATRVGGIPYEFTDDEVLMVPPSNPDHLAKAIETLLFNPEARSKFLAGYKRRQESRNLRELAADQHARVMLGE